MFTLGGWQGMDWREKVIVQNYGRALVKSKNGVVLAPWWLKWSTIYTVDLCKTSSNTGYSQPRHLPVPEAAIQAFYVTMNSSQKYVDQSLAGTYKYSVLYAGGVSLILCDFLRLSHINFRAEPILLFFHLFFFPAILFFWPILLNILLTSGRFICLLSH